MSTDKLLRNVALTASIVAFTAVAQTESIRNVNAAFSNSTEYFAGIKQPSTDASRTFDSNRTSGPRDVALDNQHALDAQYLKHPQRFVRGQPLAAMPPTCVAINLISPELHGTAADQVNFPTLTAAGAVKNTLILK